VAVLKLRYH
jgi:small subunit ribosomal protein S10e